MSRVPALGRITTAAVCVTLAVTASSLPTIASAEPITSAGCISAGHSLRYLVLFDQGESAPRVDSTITSACGDVITYYPQISVAVASSADPDFAEMVGPDRAYSAQASADTDHDLAKTDRVEHTGARPATVSTADRTGEQWDMRLIDAGQAHKITEGS
ncbi:MAG: serine protease, partial [Sciscionella sp.]|nr:serine protease [Sciscionella sp.]